MTVAEYVMRLWITECPVQLGIKIRSSNPRAIRYSPLTVTPIPYFPHISLNIRNEGRNKCEAIDYTARGAEIIHLPYQTYQII